MFELLTPQAATLTGVVPRNEMHGDEEVLAVSLGLKITAGNLILDQLSSTLRCALYMADPSQQTVPGIDPGTPRLRTDAIRFAALDFSFEGWTLSVLRRVDERVGVILPACKVDRFRLEPIEGGSVVLTFRVGTSAINAELIGDLCGQLGHEVSITLVAPAPGADKPPGDEDVAARRPLPKDKRQATLTVVDDPEQTAEAIFAAQHGPKKRGRPPSAQKGH
jgi:hypothetical protein